MEMALRRIENGGVRIIAVRCIMLFLYLSEDVFLDLLNRAS